MARSTFVSLTVSALVAAVAIGTAANAQPVPRGPEVVVDPEAANIDLCPHLARQADGNVAVAWSREDSYLGRSRVLVRIANQEGELGPATSIEKDSEAILTVLGLTAVPGGLHLLWDNLTFTEFWRDAQLDAQAQLRDSPRMNRLVGINSTVALSLRSVGGFVESSTSDRALFVRLLDDDLRAVSTIQRVSVPNATGAAILHEAGGAFVALIGQQFIRHYIVTAIRAQRFDAEGRPVGPLLRLLQPHPWLIGLAAAVGEDGTLAVSAGYGAFFSEGLITLSTFGADGTLLGFRYKEDSESGLSEESVAIDPEGRVLWVWYDINRGRSEAQVSNLGGYALSPVFPVSTKSDPGSLVNCANAVWAGNDWVVTWIMAIGKDSRGVAYIRRFVR